METILSSIDGRHINQGAMNIAMSEEHEENDSVASAVSATYLHHHDDYDGDIDDQSSTTSSISRSSSSSFEADHDKDVHRKKQQHQLPARWVSTTTTRTAWQDRNASNCKRNIDSNSSRNQQEKRCNDNFNLSSNRRRRNHRHAIHTETTSNIPTTRRRRIQPKVIVHTDRAYNSIAEAAANAVSSTSNDMYATWRQVSDLLLQNRIDIIEPSSSYPYHTTPALNVCCSNSNDKILHHHLSNELQNHQERKRNKVISNHNDNSGLTACIRLDDDQGMTTLNDSTDADACNSIAQLEDDVDDDTTQKNNKVPTSSFATTISNKSLFIEEAMALSTIAHVLIEAIVPCRIVHSNAAFYEYRQLLVMKSALAASSTSSKSSSTPSKQTVGTQKAQSKEETERDTRKPQHQEEQQQLPRSSSSIHKISILSSSSSPVLCSIDLQRMICEMFGSSPVTVFPVLSHLGSQEPSHYLVQLSSSKSSSSSASRKQQLLNDGTIINTHSINNINTIMRQEKKNNNPKKDVHMKSTSFDNCALQTEPKLAVG